MSYNILLDEIAKGPSYGDDMRKPPVQMWPPPTWVEPPPRHPGPMPLGPGRTIRPLPSIRTGRMDVPAIRKGLGAVPNLDSYIDNDQPFFTESSGSSEFGQYGAPWWSSIINQGIATTPAIIAASKKSPIPGYPGSTPVYSQPTYPPSGSLASSGSGINLSGGISTNTLMIIGLGVALFMVGSSRGRR